MSDYEFWNELGNIFDSVLAYQKKSIEFNKTFITPWVQLGHVFPREISCQKDLQGMLHEAELNPDDPQIWANLGDAFYKTGNYEEAINAYEKSIDLDPAIAWPKSNLALTLDAQGKYQEAIVLYQDSLQKFPDDRDKAVTWNRLGNTYRKLGDFENAVFAFLRADELEAKASRLRDPMVASSETNMGEDFRRITPENAAKSIPCDAASDLSAPYKSAEVPESLRSFETHVLGDAEEHEPNSEDARVKILIEADPVLKPISSIQTRSELDDLAGCLDYLNFSDENPEQIQLQAPISASDSVENLRLNDASSEYPIEPARLESNTKSIQNKTDNANTKLTGIDPTDQDYGYEPATDEQAINRSAYEEYLKDFVEPERITEDIPTAQTSIPKFVSETGGSEQAKIQFNTQNEHVWNELGNVYFNSGAYDDAIMAYKQALELAPQFAWAYSNLALTYVQKGRFDEALLLYKRSIELFKNDNDRSTAWNRMGNLYRRLQDFDNAIHAYQIADELDPDNVSISLRSRFSLLGNLLEEQPV